MKRTTASGLTVTHAPFWLVWVGPRDGGPERFPHLRVTRPQSGNGEPLTEAEAIRWWLHGATATYEAEDYLDVLRDRLC